MCRNGVTALGRPCPNGCPIEPTIQQSQRHRWTNPPGPHDEAFKASQSERFARLREMLRRDPPSKLNLEDINRLRREHNLPPLPPIIGEATKKLHDEMTTLERAHCEWCDAVMAATTDEGCRDDPAVMLTMAWLQLTRIVMQMVGGLQK
jgi:hypothetical protein